MTRYYLTPDGSTAHSTPALSDAYPYVRHDADAYSVECGYDTGFTCNLCSTTYGPAVALWLCALGTVACPSCMDTMVSSFDPSAAWFVHLLAAVDAGYYVQDAA